MEFVKEELKNKRHELMLVYSDAGELKHKKKLIDHIINIYYKITGKGGLRKKYREDYIRKITEDKNSFDTVLIYTSRLF